MTTDVTALDTSQLRSLHEVIAKELQARKKSAAQVRRELEALAKENGFTVAQLYGTKPVKRVAVRYRDPDDKSNTWTGRGKQPKWLQEYTKNGRKLEEFLIKGAN